jgi:hypothetical protein
MARTVIRLALAGAVLATGLAPVAAMASDPPPSTFCTVQWRPFYTGPHDVTLSRPYLVC